MKARLPVLLSLILPGLFLGGCSAVNPGGSFKDVQATVNARTGKRVQWIQGSAEDAQVREAIDELLKKDLTADVAVQIALLNNRELQATFEEVGISQADFVQAGLLKNPTFDASVRFPDRPPSAANVGLSVVQDFLDLLVLPLRKKMATIELEATKLRVSQEALKLATEVKTAFFTEQARLQLLKRLKLIVEINGADAELARKQDQSGNLSALDTANHRVTYNESKIELAQTELEINKGREDLNRLMGLWGLQTGWAMSAQLPAIPTTEVSFEHLERVAILQRLDLQAARKNLEAIRQAVAVNRATRFLPGGVNMGVNTESGTDKQRVTGPTLSITVPVFDQGQATIAKLLAQLRQAQDKLDALATNIRSEIREARDRLIAERDLAGYYRMTVLPERVKILQLTQQEFNFMLKGTYDLLLAKRMEMETEHSYIAVWRDYWIARADLEGAVGGKLPGPVMQEKRISTPREKPSAIETPKRSLPELKADSATEMQNMPGMQPASRSQPTPGMQNMPGMNNDSIKGNTP